MARKAKKSPAKKKVAQKAPAPVEEVPPRDFDEDAPIAPKTPSETSEAVSAEFAPSAPVEPAREPVLAPVDKSMPVSVPEVLPDPVLPELKEGTNCRFGSPFGMNSNSTDHQKLGFCAYQLYCAAEQLLHIKEHGEPGKQLAYAQLPEIERQWWEKGVGWLLSQPGQDPGYAHEQLLKRGPLALPASDRVQFYALSPLSKARYVSIRSVTRAEFASILIDA